MTLKVIRLESGDPDKIIGNPEKSIIGDVRKLLGNWNQALRQWNGERRTIRLNPDGTPVDKVQGDEGLVDDTHQYTSGYRIDIIPLGYKPAVTTVDEETGEVVEIEPQGTVYRMDVIMPDFVTADTVETRKNDRAFGYRYS